MVAVLLNAGDQVPVIAGVLVELVGKALNVAPEQIGATALKVGTILALTTTDVTAVQVEVAVVAVTV